MKTGSAPVAIKMLSGATTRSRKTSVSSHVGMKLRNGFTMTRIRDGDGVNAGRPVLAIVEIDSGNARFWAQTAPTTGFRH